MPDISTGSRTYGLLAYLFGPGRRDEHRDPHLVASFDHLAPDPGRDAAATLQQLQAVLDLPVEAIAQDRRPRRHVWHCPVRTAPGDRELTDDEWAQVAQRIVAAVGLAAGDGDDAGCRWIAVRHADDHIHIVATLVRQDGYKPQRHGDARRAQAECRCIEADFGLRRLAPGDGTSARRPTGAERGKAERLRQADTPREQLRQAVRRALAAAANEADFLNNVSAAGVLVKVRTAPSGDLLGYAVALPDDTNRVGEPVWFGGSTLAPDLSLPRIRAMLTGDTPVVGWPTDPSSACRQAADVVEAVTAALGNAPDATVAAHLTALGLTFEAAAVSSPHTIRRHAVAAARHFERAARCRERASHADARALRTAARGLAWAGAGLATGEDLGATTMLLSGLALGALAAARWHAARGNAQQAAAARQAAAVLRGAYKVAAQEPMAAWRSRGAALPAEVRNQVAAVLRTALPDLADSVLGEPAWPALVVTLAEAAESGADPARLLAKAATLRELDTADSVSEVLVWRVRRIGALPAAPAARGSVDTSAKFMTARQEHQPHRPQGGP